MENRLEELYDKMIDEAPVEFRDSQKKYILVLARIYATESCQATLDKAAGNKYLQGQMAPVGNGIDGVVYESVESIIKNNQNIVLL